MTINELREKRAQQWEAAKNFLNSHRTEKGTLTAEDDASYTAMEQEIADLGKEIARMERQEALDDELAKPVNKPITAKPMSGMSMKEDEKMGRASDDWITVRHPEDVPLARSQRLRYLRLSRHLRIELNHRRSYRRTCLLHRAAARCHSYHPRNHLNYIVNEEGLFLLQFGVRSKPSFFVAQKPEYLLAMRRKKGVFKHETHDSR